MNSSSSSSPNQTISSQLIPIDALYDSYAKTWPLTYLWLYPFVILGPLGCLLNSLSFLILRRPEFNTRPMYAYLKVYSLNSAQICLVSTFVFTSMSTRLFAWSNSYPAHFYHLFVYTPLANTGYFYGTFLDIVVTLDRIGSSNKSIRKWLRYPANTTCILGLVFCILIEFAYYFEFEPNSKQFDVIHQNGVVEHGFTLWFIDNSKFAESQFGKVILFLIYGFRDLFLMIVEICLNCVSVYYLRGYMGRNAAAAESRAVSIEMNEVRYKMVGNGRGGRHDLRFNSRLEMRASVMVMAMCFLSIGEQVLVVMSIFYPYLNPHDGLTPFYLYFLNCLFMVVKHAVNFFLFVAFNRAFRKVFMSYFI
jgi:hypothetical protein